MTRLVVALGFLVAFAAGFVVGVRQRPLDDALPPKPARDGGWLAAELKLTPDQQERMDAIWSETAFRGRHEREERRREITRARDEAIVGLIRAEDQPKYEEILARHEEQMDALDREWKDAFHDAVRQTKEILTPEQRERYERLLERKPSDRGRQDWRRSDRGRGPEPEPDRERGRDRDRRRERPSDTAPSVSS
jgi:Spy/CpxP family protein refolding chaperone